MTKSPVPLDKLTYGALSAACVTVLVYIAGLLHIPLPPEVASAFTLIVFAAVVYITPLRDSEIILGAVQSPTISVVNPTTIAIPSNDINKV